MRDIDDLEAEIVSILRRLQAAGLIADFGCEADGTPWVSFSEAYLALLQVGRQPFLEPGMQAAWASGDPDRVRNWVVSEARSIRRR